MNAVLPILCAAQASGDMTINAMSASSTQFTIQFTLFHEGKPLVMGQRTFLAHVHFEDKEDLIEELWLTKNMAEISIT